MVPPGTSIGKKHKQIPNIAVTTPIKVNKRNKNNFDSLFKIANIVTKQINDAGITDDIKAVTTGETIKEEAKYITDKIKSKIVITVILLYLNRITNITVKRNMMNEIINVGSELNPPLNTNKDKSPTTKPTTAILLLLSSFANLESLKFNILLYVSVFNISRSKLCSTSIHI